MACNFELVQTTDAFYFCKTMAKCFFKHIYASPHKKFKSGFI